MILIQADVYNLIDKIITGTNKVQIKETDVCPGNILIFQCIVYGSQGHSTVWEGTAFSGCDNDEIILLHRRFWDEKLNCTFGECNNGTITVMSTNVEGNNNSSNDSFYVSQLMVVVQPIMVGKTIECSHDNGSDSIETGNISLISNLCDTLQTVNINNSTSYSPGTGQATVTLKGTKVPIVISSSVVILFTLFFTLLLLFYGLRKKIWSISV